MSSVFGALFGPFAGDARFSLKWHTACVFTHELQRGRCLSHRCFFLRHSVGNQPPVRQIPGSLSVLSTAIPSQAFPGCCRVWPGPNMARTRTSKVISASDARTLMGVVVMPRSSRSRGVDRHQVFTDNRSSVALRMLSDTSIIRPSVARGSLGRGVNRRTFG